MRRTSLDCAAWRASWLIRAHRVPAPIICVSSPFAATSRCAELKEKPVTQAARFRELLRHDGMIVAPGAYDCITARMIARARFE
jgi:hypothetical protein